MNECERLAAATTTPVSAMAASIAAVTRQMLGVRAEVRDSRVHYADGAPHKLGKAWTRVCPRTPGLMQNDRNALWSMDGAANRPCLHRHWRSRCLRGTAVYHVRFARTLNLNRRARHRPVGAENAAIARLRAQRRPAAGASVEKLARIGGHHFRLLHGAMRAGDD